MITNGIIVARVESKHVFPGEWPSGKATDFESVYRGFESLRPSLMDSALSESEARRRADREMRLV